MRTIYPGLGACIKGLVWLGLVIVGIFLAQWQYHKGHILEKRLEQSLPVLSLAGPFQGPDKQIFLEGTNAQSRRGYRVFDWLLPMQNHALGPCAVLVERGWIPQEGRHGRSVLPDLPALEHFPLTGRFYPWWTNPFLSHPSAVPWHAEDRQIIVQGLDKAYIEELWGHCVYPELFQLSEEHPDVLEYRRISQSTLTPERHYAYAVEWACLVLLALLYGGIWFWRGVLKQKILSS